MKTYKIAAINGDGIGHEIVPMGIKVMQAAAKKFKFELNVDTFPYGAGYYPPNLLMPILRNGMQKEITMNLWRLCQPGIDMA